MINIEQLAQDRFPSLHEQPQLIRQPLLSLLKNLFHENEINDFLQQHAQLGPFEFVDRVLEHFQFSYLVSAREKERIPAEGRVVVVANHPLGTLDGLILLKLIGEVRPDVKIVTNDLLWQFEPLRPLLLPVDILGQKHYRQALQQVSDALMQEQAVIVFPAGEVSRMTPTGIRDGEWQKGFVHFARKTNSPILPIHLGCHNSALFYSLSLLYRPLGGLMLVKEMFRQHATDLPVRVGDLIPLEHFDLPGLALKAKIKLLKKHLYRLPKNKQPLFLTRKAIAAAENPIQVRDELEQSERLGQTKDGLSIFLVNYRPDSVVLKEIGRLREITFRRAGEGTGERRDLDVYDRNYQQLVLWNEAAMEVVGAYRLAECGKLLEKNGLDGLYSASLFNHQDTLIPRLQEAVELGRSFVQPKYWGKRSLDYLWQGIGAYLHARPQIKWMLGPVSISAAMPVVARDLLVIYYRYYYGQTLHLSTAKAPYMVSDTGRTEALEIFSFKCAREDFIALKQRLACYGVTIPTLYKHYTELCEAGGVHFLDFSVDAAFNYCVDGLVLVEVEQIKNKKRQRYTLES